MRGARVISRVAGVAWKRRKMCGVGAAVAVVAIAASVAVANPFIVLFAIFFDRAGTVQTVSSDPSTLNSSNPFFDPSIGTNGQACVTCHQPSQGFTISRPFIETAFILSGGRDPLFRPNDTANNPHINQFRHSPADYSLILKLAVARIGKTVPTGDAADFTVVAADEATIDKFAAPETNFPLMKDPQHPGVPTLSAFRRPLVTTNMNFNSAVQSDGRHDISNLGGVADGEVPFVIQTLLLGAGTDAAVNDSIADFMTGVYTDQTSSFLAGNLSAHGATGGVQNLLALSQSASRPCVFDEDTPTPDLTPFVEAVATPDSCTPVVVGGEIANPPGPPTFTLFDAWANLPNNRDNAGRLSVARGQAVFNKTNCVNCHTVPNLGNNASAGAPGFKNIGTDSLSVLATVKAAATTPAEAQLVQDMIDRVSQLPLYCLRLTTDHNPNACGTDPTDTTDVVTTDPGRALVTGNIADAGSFKPPILRDLPVRAPFFHAGAAPDMKHLVNYYNLRFKLGLSASEQADLVNFLNAL